MVLIGRNQNGLLDANCLTPLLALLAHEDMRIAVPACNAIAVLTDDVNLWLWNSTCRSILPRGMLVDIGNPSFVCCADLSMQLRFRREWWSMPMQCMQ